MFFLSDFIPGSAAGEPGLHHMRQISSAAVITDAYNIEKEIIGLKISQSPRGA